MNEQKNTSSHNHPPESAHSPIPKSIKNAGKPMSIGEQEEKKTNFNEDSTSLPKANQALMRELLKWQGSKFSLKKEEEKIFDTLWLVYEKSLEFDKAQKLILPDACAKAFEEYTKVLISQQPSNPLLLEQSKEDFEKCILNHGANLMEHEVIRVFENLRKAADGNPSDEKGHRYIKRLWTTDKKYVIFSDFHMGLPDDRQNLFGQSGNLKMYCEVLKKYNKADFILVENGDVEELLVTEPDLKDAEERAMLLNKKNFWDELQQHRLEKRRARLQQMIKQNPQYYEITGKFHRAGRYVRLAGNHDQDIQDRAFEDVLREVYPRPVNDDGGSWSADSPSRISWDYLLLTPNPLGPMSVGDAAPYPEFIITHGHQFDKDCNPKYAAKLGETITESLAWTMQGPDRNWKWDEDTDNVKGWANGTRLFNNNLVTSSPGEFNLNTWHTIGIIVAVIMKIDSRFIFEKQIPEDLIAAANVLLADYLIDHYFGVTPFPITNLMINSFIDALPENISIDKNFWEQVLGHNVAWEYFKNTDPRNALKKELEAGKTCLKLRHLNENLIQERLEEVFKGTKSVPSLILGHSHEVRFNPAYLKDFGPIAKKMTHYFNTGAAGRFENLIWAIEIDNGVPSLVGWHRPNGPDSNSEPERRVFTDVLIGPASQLKAAAHSMPL